MLQYREMRDAVGDDDDGYDDNIVGFTIMYYEKTRIK